MIAVDENVLDDPERLVEADPGAMLRVVAGSGAQVREASALSLEAGVDRLADAGQSRTLILTGIGSSAAPVALVRAVVGDDAPLPIVTHPGGRLPRWVGALDTVFAVSRSGTARETLEAVEDAGRRGCGLVVVARPGSPLEELARRFRGLFVPADRTPRHTRSSLWHLAVPLLMAADRLGIASVPGEVLATTADILDRVAESARPDSESFVNTAKGMALDLAGSLPVVWGSGDVGAFTAERFVRQLAANAKYPGVQSRLRDVAHGGIAVLDGPYARRTDADLFRDRVDEPGEETRIRLVLLRDDAEPEDDRQRRSAAGELAAARGVAVHEVAAEGLHPLERLGSLVGLTDFVSVYLAICVGVDPTPTRAVLELKEQVRA
ncbi:MAG: SIS domain-containing protein [Streptosporangiales bacterium]